LFVEVRFVVWCARGCSFAAGPSRLRKNQSVSKLLQTIPKVNERDRSKGEATADQQKDSRSDRDITQQIRQSIMKDKSLSTYAHNVKIITQSGQVTLKGPVRSDGEKRSVEAKATEVAGEKNVTSELNIKP
jgi:osmotically-inducible protein OsmY